MTVQEFEADMKATAEALKASANVKARGMGEGGSGICKNIGATNIIVPQASYSVTRSKAISGATATL